MKRLMSSLRMPRFCSRIHSNVSKSVEAMLKRIALRLRGDRSARAILTIEKFMPQTKLIPMSIKSTEENFVFEDACELSAVTCSSLLNVHFCLFNILTAILVELHIFYPLFPLKGTVNARYAEAYQHPKASFDEQ